MSYNSNQNYGGPTGAPPNMAANFNAMLQRSMHEQQPQEGVAEAPGSAPPANGT
jgi:U6 snRNA-associated Sm-like protein LSm1